ncbi:hypothetical protein Q4516_00830 [Mesomycoplasma ovipneumoniae]|uniref:hypothetical protein n=1 Tax=Mesomycoplasma ovipneumoniae TaxID=29562 RepID=UPI00207A51F7|nr:hypothetical protein [Mesomycoplasma ovipneumoniae]MCN0157823.1 hypothetical protein [Mesomycoplasma ovipneumoniae]MDO6825840.1 hypothetical protein [Mesomycoplasma ovipneumoniae]
MGHQLDLKSKAKKQLKKLKYLEINIKSRCSVESIIQDYDLECEDSSARIPDFLWVYGMDFCFDAINPIETIIGIDYKQDGYIYNLKLADIPKTVFFSKDLENFHFYNEIRCLIGNQTYEDEEYCQKNKNKSGEYVSQVYFSDTCYDTKDLKKLVVAFENFDDIEKCEFSISYPIVFRKIFKSVEKLKEIESLIIKEIKESVPYAKPKNLSNYHEKIFDFLSKRYEYNSEYVDINKAYLGQKVENIYNLLLKENYNFGEETQIEPIQNVFTFETYENLLKKFEKYGIKKLNLNIENRDKFILSWFDKFGPEYRKYCIELFGKNGQFYYDNLNKWTNKIEFIYLLQILFGPRYHLDTENVELAEPDYFILPSWAKLKLENFQIFYFGGQEYGFFDEIIEQFDSKKPVFWFKPYYRSAYSTETGWISPISLKNFILLYVDGQKIYYWFGHSNLYDDIYQGKYENLKYYFKEKLVKLEQDIFLRNNQDPQFVFSSPPKSNYLNKNVIESSMEELTLYRDAIKKYQEETTHEFEYFQDFIENSGLYSQQEKKLILERHFDFSLNYWEKNYYFEEIKKTDFRGDYGEKARDDKKMFADLFNGKKLRS